MKISIDIKEFWLDNEEDLEVGLKRYVIDSVLQKIEKGIREKVDEQIVEIINIKLEKKIEECIVEKTTEVFNSEIFKIDRQETTIKDYIQEKIDRHCWTSPTEAIEKIAKKYASEIMNRYDMYFASQIVIKMQENNLLKDDMVKILLENTDEG